MRHDPFLQFDSSRTAENAYYRWLRGMPGGDLAHWLSAEREEAFRQAKERLVFASSNQNGFRAEPLYQHFELLASWRCGSGDSKRVLGPRDPRTCCFCGRSEPVAKFRSDAHLVPEMLGCRDLLTNEECDDCNQRSGNSWENELGSLTLGDRAFAGVRGKGSGLPKAKAQSGNGFIGGNGKAGFTNITATGEDIVRFIGSNQLEIEVPQKAARPALAAKAVAKIGWLMLSADQRARHLSMQGWLASSEARETRLFHVWMATRIPTTVAVWERIDDDEDLAELIVMLAFGHTMLLWAPPDWKTGEARNLLLPPLPGGADSADGLRARRYTAKPDDRTRAHTRTISISFESHHRVHLTRLVDVDVIVRVGDDVAKLKTRAISPPGASAESRRFELEGGDLVGRIRITDESGHGDWSWSYDAVPNSGNLEATLEVLSAVSRGGEVDVVCSDDGAYLLRQETFSSDEEQGRGIRRLARMAHYIAFLNERLGKQMELRAFSEEDFELARWLFHGLTHGRFAVAPDSEYTTVELTLDAVEGIAASMANAVANISFRSDETTTYELLDTTLNVGATRMILFDAQLASSSDELRSIATRDGHVRANFRCSRIGHVFESVQGPLIAAGDS